jgi:hypothetical protein
VYGWGALGHQTIALLAQQFLLPETTSAVQEILNNTTPVYMGSISLWADQFRTTPEGKFSSPFHFIDASGTPPGTCGVALSDCPEEGCVVSAIANYVSRDGQKCGWSDRLTEGWSIDFTVAGPVPRSSTEAAGLGVYCPRKLLYSPPPWTATLTTPSSQFIGDIAQPLHTAGIDLGGNTIRVTFNGFKTNLHAVWDTSIPNSILGLAPNANITLDNSSEFARKLAAAINEGEYKDSVDSWVETYDVCSLQAIEDATLRWADDTNQVVCTYVLKDGDAAYNNTDVGGAYAVGAHPIVEEALARAGVRLSAWLNLIFAGKTGFPLSY